MLLSNAGTATIAGLALALTLGACATQPPSSDASAHSSSAAPEEALLFNDQDVMFASMMVPHHEQAVDMAEMVLAKADLDSAVTDLAERIRDAQAPEIELMNSWLESWGASSGHSGHAGHGMAGMLSAEQLAALEDAEGPKASRLFLDGMIAHHQGAVAMAETEVDGGQAPDAIELATKIIADQEAEIDLMKELRTSV
jgi:uncharacterized protein (DUF305 family)